MNLKQSGDFLTASDIVSAIHDDQATALDRTLIALEGAGRHAHLNPIVTLDPVGAVAAAHAVDTAIAGGAMLPLAGLTFVVKDNIDVAGLPTTGATPGLQHSIPRATASVVTALQEAGAIVIGKSNMHELALGFTNISSVPFAPTAHNPHDPSRIAGGSSGGTAVAVAAGVCTFGLGTDTGGSVRVPAALCGLAGLRPSVGDGGQQRHYPSDGVLPISATRDTIGPIARTVADLALVDAALMHRTPPTPARLDGVRLGVPRYFWSHLDVDVRATSERALARIQRAGAVLVDVDVPGIDALHELVSMPILMHEFHRDFATCVDRTRSPQAPAKSVLERIENRSVQLVINESNQPDYREQYPAAVGTHRPELQRRYREYYGANNLAAMIYPTTTRAAAAIDDPGLDDGGLDYYMRNSSPASCAGTPAITLFGGLTSGRLPVGLELSGPLGSDRYLQGLAMSIEQELGYCPPAGVTE